MSNANLSILTTSNTFLQEMVALNNVINVANELINGNYYKDNGNIFLANGTLFITPTTGTGLSVTNDVLLALLTTMNSVIATGTVSLQSNVNMTNATAFTTIDGSLIVDGNTVLGNLQVNGTQTIVGNTISATSELILRTGLSSSGNGGIVVDQGTTNGNAVLQYSFANNVWQTSANDQLTTLNTLLTTLNIADSVTSNSKINVGSANAVEWSYNTALQAYGQANAAYAAANSGLSSSNAYNTANAAYGQANAAYLAANSANSLANAAYAKANAAAVAGGSNGQVQYNSNNALGASANLTYIDGVGLNVGGVVFANGKPTYSRNSFGVTIGLDSGFAEIVLVGSSLFPNSNVWQIEAGNSNFTMTTLSDGATVANVFYNVFRNSLAISTITYGNINDNPSHVFYGPIQTGTYNNVAAAIAGAANTVAIANNNVLTVHAGSLNFINSPTMNAVVTLNSQGNANVAFNYNPSGGPAGPQGPTGATGATGATGPAGPSNVIDATLDNAVNMFPVGVTGSNQNETALLNNNYLMCANGQFVGSDFHAAAMPAARQSIASNGYTTLPGGIIMQWGFQSATSTSPQTTPFPLVFPHACFNVVCTATAGVETGPAITLINTSEFITVSGGGNGYYWQAIGW